MSCVHSYIHDIHECSLLPVLLYCMHNSVDSFDAFFFMYTHLGNLFNASHHALVLLPAVAPCAPYCALFVLSPKLKMQSTGTAVESLSLRVHRQRLAVEEDHFAVVLGTPSFLYWIASPHVANLPVVSWSWLPYSPDHCLRVVDA